MESTHCSNLPIYRKTLFFTFVTYTHFNEVIGYRITQD